MKLRRTILYPLFIVCIIFVVSCVGKNPVKEVVQIKLTAEEVSRQCPMQVDYMTTLQNCEYVLPKTLKYNYTVNVDLRQIDTLDYRKLMEENVVYQTIFLFNTEKMKVLKDLSPTIIHSYKTLKGEKICDIKVTPEMYNAGIAVKKMSDDEVYADLQKTVPALRNSLPVQIDQSTIFSDAKAIYPRVLEYFYVISDADIHSLDTTNVRTTLTAMLKRNIKKDNTDMKLRNNDVIFRYTYLDKNEVHLVSIDVTPKDYK